jgi:hypothetical protein
MFERRSLGSSAPSLLAAATLVLAPATAHAIDLEGWGASAGQFDLAQEEKALELGVDYQFRPVFWGLEPILGLGVTSDQALFGYGGLRRPFELGHSRWYLAPHFAVTLFDRGEGKDLGQTLQFRSGLEVLYELQGGTRVGFGYYHISNASMDEVNPGANSLLLRVVVPRGK